MDPPTETQIRYNSGQYLFFIPFNTGCTVTREERSYKNKQHEDWGTVSTFPSKLEVPEYNALGEFLLGQAHAICPRYMSAQVSA